MSKFSLRAVIPALGLAVKIPGIVLNWNLSYRKARREFRKQLMKQGFSQKEARELAEMYPFKLTELISTARSPE